MAEKRGAWSTRGHRLPIFYDEDALPDLGACCACGTTDPRRMVRNLIALHVQAPVEGVGWGCVVCGKPADGALAVVCDDCLEQRAEIGEAISGYLLEKKRVPLGTLTEPFDHDKSKHPELEREERHAH